ncbi:preprotein translocase subunit SecA [Mesoplasma lactucae]|uniref:Protein translocase subunit SecA n=1 Tax=Mesoplasma lactucae ATCC 49193 TaxID=81460 RepID=A0A291IRU3_9MOLU|nr:preprotein translocase subunit SecA [Mesoplasma lactucae]ATG97645.1 preprotein translocase subunit SecA [Mesoplasma lactucae ATCC 49193]ATZ19892.1 preprotein translocase subunit SecA [Mesoplasma lactucae ATCC 49193]MCL8216755.1 Protein translocase subunit SecA [Mesoplasma lactucae ATCC 49193]
MASDKRLIKKYGKIADKIIALEPQMRELKDEDFKTKTQEFKDYLQVEGNEVDDILVEAYAVAREAARRILGMNAFRVQLIGAIVLNSGDIAQMRTGEGKTLTGLFPAYLNALTGKGVHIVTVNEYLSERDAEINGEVFDFLGITHGVNSSSASKAEKRDAYAQDITYTTNSELGFDYLRDNMVDNFADKVQRGLNFAIIDEADSVLIDEARTPLIISGGSATVANLYKAADQFSKTLKVGENDDAEVDLETKQVYLTEKGIQKAKEFFSVNDLFSTQNTELYHLILNALKAQFTFKEGVEYTVRDDEIMLIDQLTGRIMEGRAYSDGLQQALQAKEGVYIEEETATLASITYQNFYRLYAKLSGMTGTAKTEEEEFIKIYNTRVVVVPTNRPVIRKDETDLTFGTKNAALKHLMGEVKEVHEKGNPILIGTTSVDSSEQIANYLDKAGFDYQMINAKNHGREAEIVAHAGEKGAITLATNMAGRGTDIKLTPEVKELGGLVVFGVEHNEARRIDDQLRGRSGRQGDPGYSRFYISMEDELMIRFTTAKTRQQFLKLGDDYIKSRLFNRSVNNAQKKLEGMNFDQRKNVLDYDNIVAQQRETMYAQRDDILTTENIEVVVERMFYTTAYELVLKHAKIIRDERTLDAESLLKEIDGKYVPKGEFKPSDFDGLENNQIAKKITNAMMKFYHGKVDGVDKNVVDRMDRGIILEVFDDNWTRHINIVSKLKSGIYLEQYAQNNPLSEYVEKATKLFNDMKVKIAEQVTDRLSQVVLREVATDRQPEQIEITDEDIEKIFNETGISKEDLSPEVLSQKFADLKAKVDPKDTDKLKRLKVQEDILQGLVIELQKRGIQPQPPKEINLTEEDVNNIIKSFGFEEQEFTKQQVEDKYKELAENRTPNEMFQLEVARQVLLSIADQIENIKANQAKNEDKGSGQKVSKGRAKIG